VLRFNEEVAPNFQTRQIINTDQSGFRYIHLGNRTLSFSGEKDTEVVVNNLNSTTHSYTIQPMLTMEGKLLSPLLVNFQEITGSAFGHRVQANLPVLSNIYPTCSKSGKLTKQHVKNWSTDCLSKVIDRVGKVCLIVDAWGGHSDQILYQIDGKEIKSKLTFYPKDQQVTFSLVINICSTNGKIFPKEF